MTGATGAGADRESLRARAADTDAPTFIGESTRRGDGASAVSLLDDQSTLQTCLLLRALRTLLKERQVHLIRRLSTRGPGYRFGSSSPGWM
jgi:hypothetical protein